METITGRIRSGFATGDLNDVHASLLHPAKLIPAGDIRGKGKGTIIPDAPGIYGWWFTGAISGVPLEGTLEQEGYRLLYIGIAPRKPSKNGSESKSTLRKRIARNHLGSRIGSSTLRRSLACLLEREMGFNISRAVKGKLVMPRQQEVELTNWIISRAALSFMIHAAPWDVEDSLIALGTPRLPLNIEGSNHEFAPQLSILRRKRRH